MRLLGGGILAALAVVAAATAATSPPLVVFKRAAHAYDKLPAVAKSVGAVQASRRIATAVDTKKRPYLVYATLMKGGKSVCILLVQSNSYRARCAPSGALFGSGRYTFSVIKGLIGGVADNNVKKVVLVGRSARKTIPLTKDGGYIYGCPAPTNCATWIREVLGYSAAGKLVSIERTH